MKPQKNIPDITFYLLAFLLALAIRLYQLGAAPLSDVEAGWALQALGLARGGTVTLGPQPAYILLTSQLFSIFGDTNFLARFIPALAGSSLVWLPCFFQRWVGESPWLKRAGVVMAFGLALDPGLVSLSRQAGSPMPAMAFTYLALASFYDRRLILAGIFAGLSLLSGPAFLQSLLLLALFGGIYLLSRRISGTTQPEENEFSPGRAPLPAVSVSTGVIAFFLTILVAGTLFLRAPQGLGALADTIPAYLKTWITPSGVPVLRLPAGLLTYQPIVLAFAMVGAIRIWTGPWEDQRSRRLVAGLGIGALIALIVSMLYAGRQVGDAAWSLIPFWAIAAIEISRSLSGDEDRTTRLVAAGLGILLSVFAIIAWFNFLSIGRYQENVVLYWVIIIGAFVLGFVALLLVIAGWSVKAARLGAVWSTCVYLGLLLFSTTWGMAVVRQNGAQELWSISPRTGQADLLISTLSDLSSWNTGLRNQLSVVVLADSPALQWALRDFPNARFEASLSSAESPPVVITPKAAAEPRLAQEYRGQDFIWQLSPGWKGVFPTDFVNWYTFRRAPLNQEQIILWARVDIFPGGSSSSAGSATP